MMLSALALLAVLQDPLAKPVTLAGTVADAAQVVAALSKASGVPLKANHTVDKQIVGLASPERPLKDVMDALATAMDASWQKEGDTYVLGRPNALDDKRKARDRASRLADLQKGLEKAKKALNDKPFTTDEAKALAKEQKELEKLMESNPQEWSKRWRNIQGRTPSERLVKRFISYLKAEDLVDIVPGQRIVVATNPTAMQVRFPFDPMPHVRQFVTENNLWAETMKPEGQAEEQTNFFVGQSQPIKEVGKVLMVVNRAEGFGEGSVMVSVKIMNAKGNMVAEAQESLGGLFADEDSTAFMKPAPLEEGDVSIEADAVTTDFLKYVRSMNMAQGRNLEVPESVKNFISRPDLNEPLSMGAQAALNTIATKKNQLVAAVLPDASFTATLFGASDTKLPLKRWLKTMDMLGVPNVGDEKTVILRPSAPIQVDASRTDRAGLTKLLERVNKEGRCSLDAAADFALTSRLDGMSLAMMYAFLLRLENLMSVFNPNQIHYLRLYGTLSGAQRDVLKRGGAISLTQLSGAQRELVHRLVFWTDDRYGFMNGIDEETMEEAPAEVPVDEDFESNPFGDYRSLKREVTERFPGGLPAGTEITAKVIEKSAYFRADEAAMFGTGPIDENQLAWEIFQKERPDLFPYAKNGTQIKEVRGGMARSWNISVKLEPKFKLSQLLRDDAMDSKKLALKDLPKEFMDKVNEQVKALRESYKDSKPGEFGGRPRGTVIPPRVL